MKIKIVNNRYLNTLFLVMLFSAIAHIIVIIAVAIKSLNFSVLLYIFNYFNILDLNILLPKCPEGVGGIGISSVLLVVIYLIIFVKNGKEEKKIK